MALSLNAVTSHARQALAVDANALAGLKAQATGSDAQARRSASAEAARQLESLFMRELLKSMREASRQAGVDASDQGGLATDLFDQQMALQMAGHSGGLAEAIQRQLARQLGVSGAPAPGSTLGLDALRRAPRADAAQGQAPKRREDFVQQHRDAAERVAQASGIPAAFLLGQAGHETGWGKSLMRTADGANAHNLFGIKAGGGWRGKVAEVTTTEYVDGQPRKLVAKFRAYDSYEESFRDYARLINDSPRYEQARAQTHSAHAYASALQQAGYATDPQYAAKLSRAIQSTLALARTPAAPTLAQGAAQTQA